MIDYPLIKHALLSTLLYSRNFKNKILFPISQNKKIEPESLRPQDHLTPVSCRNYEKFDDSIVFKPGYDGNAQPSELSLILG